MVSGYWPSGRPRGWSGSKPSGEILYRDITVQQHIPPTIDLVDFSQSRALHEGERGAILAVDGDFGGGINDVVLQPRGYNKDSVRGALLLFDKMDIPCNSFMGFGPIPGLEKSHIVGVTRVAISGSVGLPTFQLPIVAAFNALNERDGGRWAITRSLDSFKLPDNLFSPNKAVELHLLDAVPIPTMNVSYEEILNFKERRGDELIALRHFIEGLGLQATQEGVAGLGKTHAFEKLDRAIADYNAVMRETNFEKIRRSLTAKFQVDNAAVGAVVGAGASAAFGLPLMESAIGALAGALGQITANIGRGLKDNRMAGKPFEYIFHAKNEIGWLSK